MPRGRKFGHIVTEETRRKISLSQKGKVKRTESFKKNISEKLTGHVVTEETRRKISSSHNGKKKPWACKNGFKKGHIPWSLGLKLGSWEMSEEGKQKIRLSKIGSRNPQWRGGISPENKRIRRSSEFKQWRKLVFERDNYTCIQCGLHFIKGVTGHVTLHPDHIKPFATHPHLRFDIENGRTLCVECHKKTDTYGKRFDLLAKMER